MKQRIKRPLALLLTAVMVLGMLPTAAFAAEDDGLCEHHPEHTEECGYIEAVEGSPCTHQHDETCGYTLGTEEVPCDKGCTDTDGDEIIDHADGCSYRPAVEGTPCTHVHDENCGYAEAVEGHPCMYATTPCPECEAQSNDADQPPADNGGLTPQDNSSSKITALTLKNFTAFGESGYQDVDLLEQEGAVQWDVFTPYTLEIQLELTPNVTDTMTLTLPEGMKFVNFDPAAIEDGIEAVETAFWEKGERIYTYQPDNGTLTVEFSDGAQSAAITVSIQPDVAFFPIEFQEDGFTVKDAIQVQLNDGGSENTEAVVDVTMRSAETIRVPYIGDIAQSTLNAAAGDTVSPAGYVYTGWLRQGTTSIATRRLISELSFTLAVPAGFSIGISENSTVRWEIQQGETNEGFALWTLTTNEFYNAGQSARLTITVPSDAQVREYAIYLTNVSATTYGQDSPYSEDYKDSVVWTVVVKDPEQVAVELKTVNMNSVYNYTKNGNETGDFEDYQTLLSAALITNEGLQAVNDAMIYEAEFDQTTQFVTAVGIPCGWQTDSYAPTEIVVTYEDGTSVTIADESVMKSLADSSIQIKNYGFILRAADITGYDGQSIASVKVTIPGLPVDYESHGNTFAMEGATINTPFAGVWGRVRTGIGEKTSATNKFRIYFADGDAPEYSTATTKFVDSATISDDLNIVGTITINGDNGETSSAASGGDVVHIHQAIKPSNYHATNRSWETTIFDPVIYLLEPEDLAIERVTFSTDEKQNIPWNRDDITGQHQNLPQGYRLYEYTLKDTLMLGWWDADWNETTLYIDFDYRVDTAAATNTYDLRNLILYKSSLNMAFGRYGLEDDYGLNGNQSIGAVKSNPFTVNAKRSFTIGAAIQIEGENKWYAYNPNDAANTTAVFTDGATANVRITVANKSGATANDAEVYIPVPKTDGVNFGSAFPMETGFDMFVAGTADTSKASGWSVQYGQVTKIEYGDDQVPESFELTGGDWSENYSNETNMIKLSLTGSMANGTTAEIILQLKATGETSQTDSENLFKSWYQYKTDSSSMVDSNTAYNFRTLLQNGRLNGTVFADANRNGIMDEGESGVPNVPVRVTDVDGRIYETYTDTDGTYSFNSLPGTEALTVTVVNPRSADPNNSSGSYRFSQTVASNEGTIGSDVTPAADNSSASKTNFTLTDGTATVNAGLIEPYTVTFLVAGGESATSYVTPSSRKIYAGQLLSEVTERVTVSLSLGLIFENKWNVLMGGTSTTVEHSQLLNQTVTADATFTAVTSTTKNTVTAMWWNTVTNTVTQQFSHEVDWGKPVGTDFPTDETVNNRPGYNFTGWSVNGTSVIKQRNDIINAPVTGAVNYIAQYTEKSDITVTLNANGGTFADGQETAEKAGQTFGTAVEYETPTRAGYTFLGWSTSQDATTGTMSLTCPADDATYFAVWKPGTVRLTLMENGGTWATDTYKAGYIDGTVDENVTLPSTTDITREGYEFKGWYIQGDTEQKLLTDYKFPATATTLIAKWEPRQESITFDYGDESGIDPQTVTVEGAHGTAVGNDEAEKLLNVTRTGWSLTGWKNEGTGLVTPAANTGSILIEDGQKYIAQWAQGQSKLSFDAGEYAEFPNNGQVKTYYGNTGSTLEHGEPVDPTREGYRFLGWFEAASGGTAVTEFVFPQTENGEKTYHAQWEIETYTVTFRFNGGTLDGNNYKEVSVAYLGKVADVPVPTYGDANLQNWTDVATGQTYSSDEIKEREVKGNVVYSANWDLPSYQVVFGNLGGDVDATSTFSVTSGNGVFPPDPQTPEGKVFLHWLLTSDPDATKTEYSNQELAALKISENMTFQAVFGEDSYTITFITTDGTLNDTSNTSLTLKKAGKDTLVANDFPEVKGANAVFKGWFYGGETKSAQDWAGTVVTGNMQFVAAFEGNVTLNLIANGGTFAVGAQTTFTGAAETPISIPTPTRTGWTFAGWYDAPVGGNKIDDTSKLPATSAIWYAQWTPSTLTVTVEENPTYDGTAKTPALEVKSGTTALTENQYVAIYRSNTTVGTATVTVYGIGETYGGLTGTATFTIQKANQTVTFAKSGGQTATYGESFTNTAAAKLDSANTKITYSSNKTDVATVDENTGEVTILKAGEVTITAKSAETSNVNAGTESYTLTISKANPTLRFDNAAVSVKTTGTVENKLTTNPARLSVTYSSSSTNVAMVDTDGSITLMGEGTTTITATFAGNDQYNGATATYILTVDNDAIAYTAEGWYGTYDGKPHGIDVKVDTPNGAKVTYSKTENGTYTADSITQTDAGSLTVYYKIEAEKYDTVTGSATVIINKAALTEATVTGGTYTGSPVNATVSEVKAGDLDVTAEDYTVTYLNNVNASEAAVAIITANADSNFTGRLVKSFTISPKQLTEAMVSPITDQPYTGQKIQPTVTVTDSGISKTLTLGEDYTVSYGDNNTVGTGKGTVTITGKGNYEGTVTKTFNITNSGTFEVIVGNTTLTYDGKEKKPTVIVWAVSEDGKTKTQLTAGTDYTLTYAENTDAGTASVTVTGKGAYVENGENWKPQTEHFIIGKAEQEVSFAGVTDNSVGKTYGDSAFTEAATVKLSPDVSGQQAGEITYTTSDATVATVDSTTGKVTIVGAGEATITATATATDNYNGASASYTLTVAPKPIGSEDVTVSKIADQPYEGLAVKPDFTVTDNGANIPKQNLVQNVDYTVEYTDNDKIGTGKITLTGTGNYTGTKEVTFQIVFLQEFTITVAPAPITIYMGGQAGFDQVVVDEDTGAIQASKSLPVPGFLFTLPDALTEALAADNKSATDLIFQERGGAKQWTVALYNDSATNLYRLVAAAGQDPVRVQFTNAQGTTVPEDHFIVGENVNQELTMSIYRGQVGDIVVIYDGVIYPVKTGEAMLTVRGTTSAPQLPTVIAEDDFDLEALEAGKAAVTAPTGTTYAINGGDVDVTDTTGVSLLFDGIIDTDTDNRTEQLEARAEAYFNDPEDSQPPQEGYQYAYSFQYLDLVDTNNGNAWVKASNDVTVYWPIPADADRGTLQVLHFEGLHRDMATGEIETEISTATVTEVENVTIEGDYVTFEIGSAGFSPFALVWQSRIPYTITATAGSGGSITPSGNVTVLHGDSQTFTITPASGYRISDVVVDGASVGAVSTYTFDNVTANHTISVTFQSTGGGGGGGTTSYTIKAEAGDGGAISPSGNVRVTSGSDKTFTITAEDGYIISDVLVDGESVGAVSKYTFEDVRKDHTIEAVFEEGSSIADPDDTGVSGWLNTKDHIQYLGGYGGGKFGPNDNMTRAQAAQMFYNLLLEQNVPITVSFTDVPADAWYAKAVNTLGSLGIIAGIGNNQFAPERSITRAEFTVIAMRFTNLGLDGENPFSDVPDDAWYFDYVVRAAQYGWIGGYSDGTFRPNNTITRAEVTTIVNRMLGRTADKDYVDAHRGELTQFTDVSTSYWAYYQIMEATNAHDYDRTNSGEDWTRLHK